MADNQDELTMTLEEMYSLVDSVMAEEDAELDKMAEQIYNETVSEIEAEEKSAQ